MCIRCYLPTCPIVLTTDMDVNTIEVEVNTSKSKHKSYQSQSQTYTYHFYSNPYIICLQSTASYTFLHHSFLLLTIFAIPFQNHGPKLIPPRIINICELTQIQSAQMFVNSSSVELQVQPSRASRAIMAREHQGNWQPQFPRIIFSTSWTHVTEWISANWGNGNATHGETEKLNFQATEHASLLTIEMPRGFLEIICSVTRFSDSFVS
jgi:hypothetical protein